MAKKLKGRAKPLSELHFIANISLEQSAMLIQKVADAWHTVMLTEVDADTVQFEIDNILSSSRQSKINGTLQRWQGTDTRVDVTGDVVRSVISDRTLIFFLLMLVFLVTGFVVLVSGMMSKEHTFVYGFPALTIMLISAALLRSSQTSMEEDVIHRVQFRERDRLLQLVIDTFKAAATVEAYEPTVQADENLTFLSDLDGKQQKAKDT